MQVLCEPTECLLINRFLGGSFLSIGSVVCLTKNAYLWIETTETYKTVNPIKKSVLNEAKINSWVSLKTLRRGLSLFPTLALLRGARIFVLFWGFYVVLAVLKLTMWTRLALNLQKSICLWHESAHLAELLEFTEM